MKAYKYVIPIYYKGKLADVYSPVALTRWKINEYGFFYIENKGQPYKRLGSTIWREFTKGIFSYNFYREGMEDGWSTKIIPMKITEVWLSGRIIVGEFGYVSKKATSLLRKEIELPEPYTKVIQGYTTHLEYLMRKWWLYPRIKISWTSSGIESVVEQLNTWIRRIANE